MKLIFRLIRRHLGKFLTAVAFLSLEALADLMQPTLMSEMVDRGVAAGDRGLILRYGGVMLLVCAIGAAGAVMRNLYASRTSQKIGMELRREMVQKTLSLSFENVDRLRPAAIVTNVTSDVTQIQDFVNSMMRIVVKMPITCVGAIALILLRTPEYWPVLAAILAAAGALILGNMAMGYPRFGALQRRLDRLNDVSRTFLSSIRVVKAFSGEAQERKKFDQSAEELAEAGAGANRVAAVFGPSIALTVNLGIVAVLYLAGNVPEGIGKLMAVMNYMTQLLFSLNMVSNLLNRTVRAVASAHRVEALLDEASALTSPDAADTPAMSGSVTFEGVSFAYAGSARATLRDVRFHLPPGSSLGIIGATGSGKTTLVNLALRFYDPDAGRVLLDGADIRHIPQDALRKGVTVVPQKSVLFSGAILENLRWGREDAPMDAVRRAAAAACADEFVQKLPLGYATVLGQGGVNLSGGQKQRLCLARALLREAKVLILDDCTSALDAQTEARVLRNLRERPDPPTMLLVSQRICAVMGCDRILVLEGGRVAGLDTHENLMRNSTVYREIYESQIGGEDVAG